jgi:hypothetical protein
MCEVVTTYYGIVASSSKAEYLLFTRYNAPETVAFPLLYFMAQGADEHLFYIYDIDFPTDPDRTLVFMRDAEGNENGIRVDYLRTKQNLITKFFGEAYITFVGDPVRPRFLPEAFAIPVTPEIIFSVKEGLRK